MSEVALNRHCLGAPGGLRQGKGYPVVSRLDSPPLRTMALIGELGIARRMQEGMGLLLTNPVHSSSSPSLPEPSSPLPLGLSDQ